MEPGGKPPKPPKKTPPKPSTPRGREKAIEIADKRGKKAISSAEAKRVAEQVEKDMADFERQQRRVKLAEQRAIAEQRRKEAEQRRAAALAKKGARHTTDPSSSSSMVSARHRTVPKEVTAPPPLEPPEKEPEKKTVPKVTSEDLWYWARAGAPADRPPIETRRLTSYATGMLEHAETTSGVNYGTGKIRNERVYALVSGIRDRLRELKFAKTPLRSQREAKRVLKQFVAKWKEQDKDRPQIPPPGPPPPASRPLARPRVKSNKELMLEWLMRNDPTVRSKSGLTDWRASIYRDHSSQDAIDRIQEMVDRTQRKTLPAEFRRMVWPRTLVVRGKAPQGGDRPGASSDGITDMTSSSSGSAAPARTRVDDGNSVGGHPTIAHPGGIPKPPAAVRPAVKHDLEGEGNAPLRAGAQKGPPASVPLPGRTAAQLRAQGAALAQKRLAAKRQRRGSAPTVVVAPPVRPAAFGGRARTPSPPRAPQAPRAPPRAPPQAPQAPVLAYQLVGLPQFMPAVPIVPQVQGHIQPPAALAPQMPAAPAIAVGNNQYFATSWSGLVFSMADISLPHGTIRFAGQTATIQCAKRGAAARGDIVSISKFIKKHFKLGGFLNQRKMTSQRLIRYVISNLPGTFVITS